MSSTEPPPFPGSPLPEPPSQQNWKAKLRTLFARLARIRPGYVNPGDLRERLRAQYGKFRQLEWVKNFPEKLSEIDPQAVATWANDRFQAQKFGGYGKAATIVLCSFFLADLLALILAAKIPDPPVVRQGMGRSSARRQKTLDDYNIIFARNLFNSRGLIPGEEAMPGSQDPGGAPVKTTLPFNLVGTLILRDELRSIATIEDKSAAMVYPLREQDEIPTKAKIVKIEPTRVIFINTASGRREYVELPEDATNNARITLGSSISKAPGIERASPTQFNIAKTEVDKTFADLPNVLTQARCIPNLENGAPNGFRCFQIVPGSIYDKLGMVNNDVVLSINGQSLNDPTQAVAQLSEFKNANHLELIIKRGGKVMNFAYDIR